MASKKSIEDRSFALDQQVYSSHARHEHVSEEQGVDADDDVAEEEEEDEQELDEDLDSEEEEVSE